MIMEFAKAVGAAAKEAQKNDPAKTKKYILERLKKNDEEIEGLELEIIDDMIKLKGKCKDPSTFEKAILLAGNITGISKVAADGLKVIGKEIKEAKFYTIKSGDTLSGIAKKHLGNASRYMEIVKANKGIIDDPDKIYPGQTIRIP
ncbi:peptidoglycan-binding protein LysM [Candidatus Fermentibacteria bacterium]|nr:MAG: peptidoglycan-binding protein LysM [Candidatus Fermentibacteria bacterium]PIE52349.1 MAG: peptidoglycan-binding protein LysM [Candidatus Fermentibacteria bacterium]